MPLDAHALHRAGLAPCAPQLLMRHRIMTMPRVLADALSRGAPVVLAVALLVQPVDGGDDGLRRFEYRHAQMGTWFRLVAYAADKEIADATASAAFERVDALNAALSDYLPRSEVCRLTADKNVGIEVPVGEDLSQILRLARPIEEASGGAFDLTIGPLTRLWRVARDRGSPPEASEIQEAKRLVGYQMLAFDPNRHSATPAVRGMRIDLGGIAKGYAADSAIAECRKRGLGRVLMAGGGDIVVGDPPPNEKGWRIGLPPKSGEGLPDECLILANGAISTSGDRNQFLEYAGKRHSHVIDPRTGWALVDSCTVTIAISGTPSNGLMADALATAANVLGPDEAPRFLSRFDMAGARILKPGKPRPVVITTPRFEKWEVVPRLPMPPAEAEPPANLRDPHGKDAGPDVRDSFIEAGRSTR